MTITDYDPTDKKSLSERDIQGWMPRLGQRDAHGYAIPPEVYYGTDFDKRLVIEERTQFVAHLVTEHLKATNRMHKTIVFAAIFNWGKEHFHEAMRELQDIIYQD